MTPPAIRLSYVLQPDPERWLLDENEEPMSEGTLHDEACELLKLLLKAFVARRKLDALVSRNLALRWDQMHPGVGVDPDVALFVPRPDYDGRRRSVRLWLPGCSAPVVAIEVVSFHEPEKDYIDGPEKYAASGARELWVFDPELHGPALHGGPFRLQVWRRTAKGAFRRTYAGAGPAYSKELMAFLVVTENGERLRIAEDMAGAKLWPTEAEEERAGRLVAEEARAQAEQRAEAAASALAQEQAARRALETELERLESDGASRTRSDGARKRRR